ncbi:site-specific DNA-methyltransferase (adenine-specific) [Phaeobacter italicus]|nr:site-specific DNA-methyltransferase (adenine-specific) [Phaeobacter italicus]
MFFALRPDQALLSDLNAELVNTYVSIRDEWRSVETHLREHQASHSKEHYYKVRGDIPEGDAEKAARFIYLNRTCWNGLYRVNLKGEFNVPIGTKTKVFIEGELESVSLSLKGANIKNCDFEERLNESGTGDLVFVDPPYTVHHNMNGFLKYNQNLFSWEDQIRLRDAVVRASERGAKVLVTNAAHYSVIDLYDGVGEMSETDRLSVISGKSSGRGRQAEILVKCF